MITIGTRQAVYTTKYLPNNQPNEFTSFEQENMLSDREDILVASYGYPKGAFKLNGLIHCYYNVIDGKISYVKQVFTEIASKSTYEILDTKPNEIDEEFDMSFKKDISKIKHAISKSKNEDKAQVAGKFLLEKRFGIKVHPSV